jgi:hypothetical protein
MGIFFPGIIEQIDPMSEFLKKIEVGTRYLYEPT